VAFADEYMVMYTPKPSTFEQFSIDPGIDPGWSGYKTEHRYFDTLGEALIYINKGQYRNTELYRIEKIELTGIRNLKSEEIVRHYTTIYKIKEAE